MLLFVRDFAWNLQALQRLRSVHSALIPCNKLKSQHLHTTVASLSLCTSLEWCTCFLLRYHLKIKWVSHALEWVTWPKLSFRLNKNSLREQTVFPSVPLEQICSWELSNQILPTYIMGYKGMMAFSVFSTHGLHRRTRFIKPEGKQGQAHELYTQVRW